MTKTGHMLGAIFFTRDLTLDVFFFFFNDTATTEISPLPLHDALPISATRQMQAPPAHGHFFPLRVFGSFHRHRRRQANAGTGGALLRRTRPPARSGHRPGPGPSRQ